MSDEEQERIDRYIEGNGLHCPWCESTDITADSLTPHDCGRDAHSNCECNNCGKRWIDHYTLTGMEEML
ncbi:MAG: hypothetical protein DRP09_10445 [Candidatus Thorarchaeota archaeon]|nr:MAG: hypothetical protein DRP09_10445 [Candidatus Thorarchaeota archaeon]